MKKQSVTLTCITPDGFPTVHTFSCFVFGVWAVHRPHPNGDPNYWHVSHIATSAVAVVTERFTEASRAARRLATIDPPPASVKMDDDGRIDLDPPPARWNRLALEMMCDLDVYVTRSGYLIRPYDVLQTEYKR